MPIYEYRTTGKTSCSFCLDGFELLRKSSDPAVISCPRCGAGVERIQSVPSLATSGPSLDAKNVEQHGFTQYRKSGKGVYEKTAGKGPNVISADSD